MPRKLEPDCALSFSSHSPGWPPEFAYSGLSRSGPAWDALRGTLVPRKMPGAVRGMLSWSKHFRYHQPLLITAPDLEDHAENARFVADRQYRQFPGEIH